MASTSVNQSVEMLFMGDPEIDLFITHNDTIPASTEGSTGSVSLNKTNGGMYSKNSLGNWVPSSSVSVGHPTLQWLASRMAAGETLNIAMIGDSQTEGQDTTTAGGDTIGRPSGWPTTTTGAAIAANPTESYTAVGDQIGLAEFNTQPEIADDGHTRTHRSPNAFPAIVQNYLEAYYGYSNINIWNWGYSGKTVKWHNVFYSNLKSKANYGVPDAVFIQLGTNDVIRATSVRDDFRTDLQALIAQLRADNPDVAIVLVTPQLIWKNSDLAEDGTGTDNDSSSNMLEIEPVLYDMAAAENLPIINMREAQTALYTKNKEKRHIDNEQFGGLHYVNSGHPFIADTITAGLLLKLVDFKGGVEQIGSLDPRINLKVPTTGTFLRPTYDNIDTNDVSTYPEKFSQNGLQMPIFVVPTDDGVSGGDVLYDMWVMVHEPCALVYNMDDLTSDDVSPNTDNEWAKIKVFNKGDLVNPYISKNAGGGTQLNAIQRMVLSRPHVITYNLPIGLNRVTFNAPVTLPSSIILGAFELNSLMANNRSKVFTGKLAGTTSSPVYSNALSDGEAGHPQVITIPTTGGAGWFVEEPDNRNIVDMAIPGKSLTMKLKCDLQEGMGIGLLMGNFAPFNSNGSTAPEKTMVGHGLCLMKTGATNWGLYTYEPRQEHINEANLFQVGKKFDGTTLSTSTGFSTGVQDLTITMTRDTATGTDQLLKVAVYDGDDTTATALLEWQERNDLNDRVDMVGGRTGVVFDNRAGGNNLTGTNGTVDKEFKFRIDQLTIKHDATVL